MFTLCAILISTISQHRTGPVTRGEGNQEASAAEEPVLAKIQEGKKRGSINYVIGTKLYLKDVMHHGNIYASCIKKHKGCRGRASIAKDSLEVTTLSGHHSCDIDATYIAKIIMENKMKKMAEETSLSLRQIYDEISQDDPDAADGINWPTIEAAMSKRRIRSNKCPMSANTLL